MIYGFVKHVFRFLSIILFTVKVTGYDNIPSEGRVVLCSNHFNFWDPVLIAAFMKRKVHFMAKAELFQYPILKWILTRLGAFPVKRGVGDRKALKSAIDLLENDKVFGIFPEGTRSKTGEIQKGEPGLSYIALKGKSPIIPIGIVGNYKLFSNIQINIGQPMNLEHYYEKKVSSDELQEISDRVIEQIISLRK